MIRSVLRAALVPAVALWATASAAESFVIVGATVVDGTGAPARKADVRVKDGRIAAIGKRARGKGIPVVEGSGFVLAPGFIDTHSHHDRNLDAHLDALAPAAQGITTIVVGQDGGGPLPVAGLFAKREAQPAAVNVATYIGHNSVRDAVMGADYKRAATPAEVDRMVAVVEDNMRAGALGLSTGLEYDPGIYSDPSEVMALARATARHGGRYISHMRSEDTRLDAAIDELLEIGRTARLPVQISHFKIAIVDRWGDTAPLLAKLDAARRAGIDVTADVYPYTYWQSNLEVLLPKRDFTDLAAAEFALAHMARPEDVRLTQYPANPAYVGKTVAEVAAMRSVPPARAYLDLIVEAEAKGMSNAIMGRSMADDDVAALIAWPHSNICSDGGIEDAHPRGAGAFPRVLAWMVRETGRLKLEEAVYKMSGLAADHMGIGDRGRIAVGQAADLVLFDPATVADRATVENPTALPVGIRTVWVNGVAVVETGKPTGALPGQIIRRAN